jgi:hypothetical protein
VLGTEMEFLRAFAVVPELDILTLDIYQLEHLPIFTEMTTIARQNGKRVYVEETWRPPFAVPGPGDTLDTLAVQGVGDQGFKVLDAKWLQAVTQYAGGLGLEAVTPFWTQTFFKYVPEGGGNALDPGYTLQVAEAIRNGERTETFFAFRSLIRRSVPPRREIITPMFP